MKKSKARLKQWNDYWEAVASWWESERAQERRSGGS